MGLLDGAMPNPQRGSAIETMLGLLAQQHMPQDQPGQPPMGGPDGPGGPPDTAPPMGTPVAPHVSPMAPQQAPGMVDRIKQHLSGLLDIGAPSAPHGYEGLLSPDDIQSAKPGFMARLASITPGVATPGQQYRDNLNNIIGMHQLASGVAERQRIMQGRREIGAQYPMPDNPTDAQIRNVMGQRYAAFMALGDEESMKDTGNTLRGIMTAPKPETSHLVTPGATLTDKDGKPLFTAPDIDKAGDYTQYVDPNGDTHSLRKNVDPPKGWKPVSLEKTQVTVNAAGDRAATAAERAEALRSDKGVRDYTKDIKPLTDRGQMLDQALVTLGSAASDPNPANRKALYKSAMANFVQAADQKAQLRVQMLQYFNQIDPSIGGRWDSLKDQLLKGERPAYQLQGMIAHIKNLKGLVRGEIDQRRNGLISRRPELADALPKTDEFFTPEAPTTGYSPGNPFAKKKP